MARKVANDAVGNGFDPAIVRSFIDKIEAEHAALESERGVYMARCKSIRETIAMHVEEAKSAHGIPRKALKTVLDLRAAERRKEALVEKLAGGDGETFDILATSLGDFASLPLGYAALRDAKMKDAAAKNSAALASLAAYQE